MTEKKHESLFVVKCRAAVWHGLVSLLIAGGTAAVVFGVWYPSGLAERLAGTDLFLLVLSVEVCLGPLMSLVIYNPSKPRAELIRDYTIVAIVQLVALGYGLHSTYIARPVYEVFVIDRIDIVSAFELDNEDVQQASLADFRSLPISGPMKVCIQRPEDAKERSDILKSALRGKDIHLMPKYYRFCHDGEALSRAWPESLLLEKLKSKGGYKEMVTSLDGQKFTWLPVKSRLGSWIEAYPDGDKERVFYIDANPFELFAK